MEDQLWQPLQNEVLVSIPERFTQKYAVGTKRLYMPAGSDDWAATTEALKLGFGTATEANEEAHQTRVQTGTVLAIPRQLTADMVLCSGLGTMQVRRIEGVFDNEHRHVKDRFGRDMFRENGTYTTAKPKTAADIAEQVAVGDTVYVEGDYLDDEHEISPGVYRLPYSALICITQTIYDKEARAQCWLEWKDFLTSLGLSRGEFPVTITPIAGYVMLTRVWADDVVDAAVEGRTTKARFSKVIPDLVDEVDVKPLENEGIVAHIGPALRGTPDDLTCGQRVVFQAGHALIEEIAGNQYICIRHEYCLAVREPSTLAPKGNV